MYEWLKAEIAAVKTPKFFIVSGHGDAADDDLDALAYPASYACFLREFGSSKFFRDSTNCYMIGIYPKPKKQIIDNDKYWEVGWYDESTVLLKERSSGQEGECPLLEWSKFGKLKRVADTFEDWLRLRWNDTKTKYSARKWKKVLDGPKPFTPEEMKIVEARRKFHWRVLGIDEKGIMRFEVSNESDRRLPYIGIGVRETRHRSRWGIALRVDHILPGTKGIAQHDMALKTLRISNPNDIEVFEDEEPGPEDRELYWEFRPLPDEGSTR